MLIRSARMFPLLSNSKISSIESASLSAFPALLAPPGSELWVE